MPAKNQDLHGNVPDKAEVALLLIDVINDLEFPEGDQLLRYALPMADRIAELKRRAREAEVPVIYVNDNFGRWRSDFNAQVEHCLQRRRPGPAAGRAAPARRRTTISSSSPSTPGSSRRRSTSCSNTSRSRR